ncbi:N-formylglutamate amidohydrolase [Zavarzinia compransoris]|uniref:N-formylglutamate amidohydrolase n=1 Tax=Zavarzinia compransoris TaxID=1264899 RepID=UPI0010EA41F0|nr:N-formylglutamate amidohydrolase [Zavarzinia compransoris]TDP48844.1 N-formylglutamate amidohydrolase [Zavarzinia compransoris]
MSIATIVTAEPPFPSADRADEQAVVAVAGPQPGAATRPLVLSSPHSGATYPPAFLRQSRLDPVSLRRSEDCFVDRLFASAPRRGATLVRALFPRAYVDPNREPYELDPAMFRDNLPAFANTRSLRVLGGLGTIARVVADGAEIYREKLAFAEAEARIAECYRPYHAALAEAIGSAERGHGMAILLDCHSMPSLANGGEEHKGRPDIVLGDRFGMSCAAVVIETAERLLRTRGYRVGRNDPYAGGYITHHYGRPRRGRHALQIEINRALYMDETRLEPNRGFAQVQADLDALIEALAGLPETDLKAAP